MSNTVLVIGESGTGKSTSISSLQPKETFIINVLDKPLPFKGYKKNYERIDKDCENGNYYATDNYELIVRLIKKINEKRSDIKNIIIDDWQYVMANEFMNRATERGFDKFTEIAQHAWLIVNELSKCREDINCFVLCHSELDQAGKFKCKTIGKMLDEKITVEGMFTVVLHTKVLEGKYLFLTQNDGLHISKSPQGMFEDKYIKNDLLFVKESMLSYYNEEFEDVNI